MNPSGQPGAAESKEYDLSSGGCYQEGYNTNSLLVTYLAVGL
jgi:hypothetical protein